MLRCMRACGGVCVCVCARALQTLSNPEKRGLYDKYGHAAFEPVTHTHTHTHHRLLPSQLRTRKKDLLKNNKYILPKVPKYLIS